MKKLLILLSVLFSLVFSPPSYSEWKEVSKSLSGTTFYVDYERIIKRGDYTFYWQLTDYVKPSPNGSVSSKAYLQVDCNLFRYKFLSDWYYKKQLGQGEAHVSSSKPDEDWHYPQPDSSFEYIFESVCSWWNRPLKEQLLSYVSTTESGKWKVYDNQICWKSTKKSHGIPEKMFQCVSIYTDFKEGEYYFYMPGIGVYGKSTSVIPLID